MISKKNECKDNETNYIESISITKERRFMKRLIALSTMSILLLSISALIKTTSIRMADSQTLPNFNFAAAGDWGCNANTNNTVHSIIDKNPELVLGLGDYSYKDSADCWFQIVDPIEDKMKIAIGNHDIDLEALMDYFGLSEQYYSFDYQNIHFISLGTEEEEYLDMSNDKAKEQLAFVQSDLEKASSNPNIDWIVVYFHRLMYSSPSENPVYPTLRNTYHPLFNKYGVDLVLQAHNHNYQRTYPIKFNSTSPSAPIETSTNTTTYTDPDGEIFATVGTGGKDLFPFTGKKDYIVKQYRGFGILNVDITNDGKMLTGKFYANNNGTIIDQFTITKK
jgi:hypothetical protein